MTSTTVRPVAIKKEVVTILVVRHQKEVGF